MIALILFLSLLYLFGTIMCFGLGLIDLDFASGKTEERKAARRVRYCYLWPLLLVQFLVRAFTQAGDTLRRDS